MSAVAAAEKEKTPPARLRRACHGFAALRCPAVLPLSAAIVALHNANTPIASGGILLSMPAALTWLPVVLAPPMRPLLARMLRWHKTFEYFFGRTHAYASMLHRPKKCHAVLRATGAYSAIPPSPSTWRALGVRW